MSEWSDGPRRYPCGQRGVDLFWVQQREETVPQKSDGNQTPLFMTAAQSGKVFPNFPNLKRCDSGNHIQTQLEKYPLNLDLASAEGIFRKKGYLLPSSNLR